MAADQEAWRRYAAWEGTYRSSESNRPLSLRMRQVLLWLAPVMFIAGAWSVIHQVHRDGWGSLAVLGPQVVLLAWLVVWLRRPPQTRLTAEGLVVRSEPWRTRIAAWGDVVEVQLPGRFEEHPVAVLLDGKRLPLVGLPAIVAEEMAASRGSVPSSRSRGIQVSVPTEGLDGPFRRGRSDH